jgi:hypothetical protein
VARDSGLPPVHAGVAWAVVAGWLGLLASVVVVLALYPPADRAALIAGAGPALVNLATAAGLWFRQHRTDATLDERIRTAVREEIGAAPRDEISSTREGGVPVARRIR